MRCVRIPRNEGPKIHGAVALKQREQLSLSPWRLGHRSFCEWQRSQAKRRLLGKIDVDIVDDIAWDDYIGLQ